MSMFRFARRPSPALIVSCCALFVALGGTSYALAVGSVGSPQVRDDSLRSIDVHNRSLSGHDVRPDSLGADAIKEEALDVSKLVLPSAPQEVALRVFVRLDGRHAQGRGVEDVDHLRTGVYAVHFDREVSDCFPFAMPGNQLAYGPEMTGAAEIRLGIVGEDPRAVQIFTGDSAGRPLDHDFYLAILC